MTKLCLGTVQFGMNYGVQGNGQPDLAKAIEILNVAYDAGIRIYDTAAAYGSAEDVLHHFISQKSIERNSIRVLSKTKSADSGIVNDARTSLLRLGIDHLDGCLLHDANLVFDSNATSNLKKLKDNGLATKLGISVYTPEQAIKSLDYDFVDIVQVPYNVLDRRLDKVHFFERAHDTGISIYVRSVLLQGLLMMNQETLPQHMAFTRPYVRAFQSICEKHHVTYFDAAVNYVLNHEYIDYLVFGVDNINQLNDYIFLSQKSQTVDTGEMFSGEFETVDERVLMPNLWNM